MHKTETPQNRELTVEIPVIYFYVFRHQIQHYTGQLAKDTSKHLHDMNNGVGDQRQWRLQKDRLQNDFTKALNSFQAAQRTAAQKEKEAIKRAKAAKGAAGKIVEKQKYFSAGWKFDHEIDSN